jgi:hypothetical protein
MVTGITHSTYIFRKRALLPLAAIFFLGDIVTLRASQSVELGWDPNSDPDLAGYRLYSGTTSGVYTQQIEVGNATTTLVSNLIDGTTYFFAITAYNTSSVESPQSNEISYTVPSPNPSPTPTPSPLPTATPSPSPTPTPTPLPTPVPTPSPQATPTPTPTPTPFATPTPPPKPIPNPSVTPKISISATPTSIKEGQTATYTVTASSINPNGPTIVHYAVKGSARLGIHFTLSGHARGQINIPPSRSSAIIRLTALRTNLTPGRETAKIVITAGTGYKVSIKNEATVTIAQVP